jgi:hypothetical protein
MYRANLGGKRSQTRWKYSLPTPILLTNLSPLTERVREIPLTRTGWGSGNERSWTLTWQERVVYGGGVSGFALPPDRCGNGDLTCVAMLNPRFQARAFFASFASAVRPLSNLADFAVVKNEWRWSRRVVRCSINRRGSDGGGT